MYFYFTRYSLLTILLLAGCLISLANAAPYFIRKTHALQNDIGQYRYIVFNGKKKRQTFSAHVVLLQPNHYRAKLKDVLTIKNYSNHLLSLKRVTQNEGAFLGINGGYFSEDYRPLGLSVINLQQTSRFSRAKMLSGLILINQQGHLSIQWKNFNYKNYPYVLQSGPFLLRDNQKIGSQKNEKIANRTILATSADKRVLVIAASKVSLHHLGYVLQKYPNAFGVKKIKCALNLDGGSSSGLVLLQPNFTINLSPQILSRNLLFFYY